MYNESENGFFGEFGGKYIPEVLSTACTELEAAFKKYMNDKDFLAELKTLQQDYIGRETPLMFASRATELLGGGQVYIKLEGLANTGAHKINNAIGQVLLAKKMGKTRIIAETGAGQHGVATAAKVVSVKSGSRTLKDAVNEAMRDWATNFKTTHYCLGSALGPAPFVDIVRTFQSIIGQEVKEQAKQKNLKIDSLVACVGGGSNASGFFAPFFDDLSVKLYGAEAGGSGPKIGQNASRMTGSAARTTVLQGYKSRFLVDEDGQSQKTSSISAGLDYLGISPQLAMLGQTGRIHFDAILDSEALNAVSFFAKNEGILMALESAHAAALAMKLAPKVPKDKAIIINMSGRGDKDVFITSPVFRPEEWKDFLRSELKRLEEQKNVHEQY